MMAVDDASPAIRKHGAGTQAHAALEVDAATDTLIRAIQSTSAAAVALVIAQARDAAEGDHSRREGRFRN